MISMFYSIAGTVFSNSTSSSLLIDSLAYGHGVAFSESALGGENGLCLFYLVFFVLLTLPLCVALPMPSTKLIVLSIS